MEEFSVIYKILKILKDTMDYEEFDNELLSPEAIKLSVPKWSRIMALIVKEGYVTGISCMYPRVKLIRPEITLKGLEYLEQNSLMKKAANIAKRYKRHNTRIIKIKDKGMINMRDFIDTTIKNTLLRLSLSFGIILGITAGYMIIRLFR